MQQNTNRCDKMSIFLYKMRWHHMFPPIAMPPFPLGKQYAALAEHSLHNPLLKFDTAPAEEK